MTKRKEPIATAAERAEERLLPSVWAERRRRIGGRPWSFVGREFLREIHDDFARNVVVKKAAQLGFTEVAQNRLAHSCDFGTSAMMVLATDDDAKRHSKARFKALCDDAPYIKGMFRETDSVDVKLAMDAALYFEGSNSKSALYSVPIGLLIVDEVDRCVPDALEAATHRLDGCESPCEMWISTPTFPDLGIDKAYQDSDQKAWMLDCPAACGWNGPIEGTDTLETWDAVRWDGWPNLRTEDPHALAATARIECPKCGHRWAEPERRAAIAGGKWVARRPGHPVSGYAINQFYSPTLTVTELVRRYLVAANDVNPEKLRQFVNQCLGMPFLGEGEEIRPADVRECLVPAIARPWPATCIGADVGKVIHVAIGGRIGDTLHVGKYLTLTSWHELERLIRAENARSVVVDHNPERRNAEDLCSRFPSVVYRADHPEGMKSTYNWDAGKQIVQIAHVSAVDLLLSRIRRGPSALRIHRVGDVDDAVRHLSALGVVLEPGGKHGQPERRVVKKGADHFAFATIYLEAAASRFVGSGDGGGSSDFGTSDDAFSTADSEASFAGGDAAWGDDTLDPSLAWERF